MPEAAAGFARGLELVLLVS